MDTLSTTFGDYTLQRLPIIKKQLLRAWDAADELLLNHTAEQQLLSENTKLLVINDQFGALSTSLNQYSPQSWSDSYQSHLAAQHNLTLNQLTDNVNYIPSIQAPTGSFDLVLIKVPKTIALLESQLIALKAHISKDTKIVAAGMVKHIHTSTLKLFETILGETKTSLASKKARLIFSTFEQTEAHKPSYPKSFHDKDLDITLSNHANVFAKDKLDMGARFMAEQFKQLPESKHIIDLGCGNGVLGILAKRQLPNSQLTFIDESYMAVDSAKTNYLASLTDEDSSTEEKNQADFLVSDGLSKFDSEHPIDLILCNPPFHQQYAIGDHIAWEMLSQSQELLQEGGQLWVVGNRHLAYHIKLKRLFGNCQTIASNKKFVVLASKK
ncbi:MAG: methyltransferase [Thiotrichaceae bacterium]